MLAAVGDHDVGRRAVEAGVAQRLGRDGLAQLGQAGGGRVVVVLRVAAGGDGRLHDVLGGREVGLAGAEADDVLTLGLQGLGLGVDGQRGRLGDGGNACGDPCHGCHAGTVTPQHTPQIRVPDDLLPGDGRFGCGPSKVRPEAVAALAEVSRSWLGTSHRQAPVKRVVGRIREGLRTLFAFPQAGRSCSATAARRCSGTSPPSGSSSTRASTSCSGSSPRSSPPRRQAGAAPAATRRSSPRRRAPIPGRRASPTWTPTPSPTTRRRRA